ncbi:hypothetical protein G5B31_13320 [Rhodobacter sp. SGA-6-6]|uniref:hypothetical protein n=1 Tax=Rhodobacter sp. SGA-6-6 TaxID=2710882 RepID=UPI0013ECF644|nr:hypothetical protein [Rhodobacter sp. SGA-6-6]NGM46517.1 hypothetical protein [Rhodobacter sp. SGA-6-6]
MSFGSETMPNESAMAGGYASVIARARCCTCTVGVSADPEGAAAAALLSWQLAESLAAAVE